MKEFIIPYSWVVAGLSRVKASSLAEAVKILVSGRIPLTEIESRGFVGGSFQVDYEKARDLASGAITLEDVTF